MTMDRETTDEIKRHFNVVAEALRSEIRTVAEAQLATNERLDRIEARMAEEFAEVRAMIRLSFGELDRRISSLEADVSSLRARLERLEGRLGA
jgi:chromosome segregation ATPase